MSKDARTHDAYFEYDVFISYRTREYPDYLIAEQLQNVLERFPVPQSMKAHIVDPRRWRSRLRVFRDITDLNASPDLSHTLKETLRRSRFLVAVCTPKLCESATCCEEIRYFREIHGDERILTLLALGEPGESFPDFLFFPQLQDKSSKDELPDSVTRKEPLAADVREGTTNGIIDKLKGKGVPKAKQARFKLLAPILNCKSPDELVRRNRARLRRQVVRLSCLIVVLVCITIAPKLARNFFTFQLGFADTISDTQRREVIISRRFNPFGYRLDTMIFEDELADAQATSAIHQRIKLSVGLTPDWEPFEQLLDPNRTLMAEIEWLERPISKPEQLSFFSFDAIVWGRVSPVVTNALIALLHEEKAFHRANAALVMVQLYPGSLDVFNTFNILLKDEYKYYKEKWADGLAQVALCYPKIINSLIEMLGREDYFARSSAVDALGRLRVRDPKVVDLLISLLKDESRIVGVKAAKALAQLGQSNQETVDTLIGLLEDDDIGVVSNAGIALGQMGVSNSKVIATLVFSTKDESADVRSNASEALGKLGVRNPKVIEALVRLLNDQYGDVIRNAAIALGQLGVSDSKVIDALFAVNPFDIDIITSVSNLLVLLVRRNPHEIDKLISFLENDNPLSRSSAAKALGELGVRDSKIIDALITPLEEGNSWFGLEWMTEALGQLGVDDDKVINILLESLKHNRSEVRSSAAKALANLEIIDPKVFEALVRMLRDNVWSANDSAGKALGRLGQRREDWTDERMIENLADFDSSVRTRAGIVLAYRDEKIRTETIGKVRALQKDSRPWVRQAARHAFYHIEKRKAERKEETRKQSSIVGSPQISCPAFPELSIVPQLP